ncbi:MAG: RecX family transcriptional regulator [Flavobacteriia bacterium]|jgi:regulatory protein|nr:RecX family transcriptional regulator [Flavobacteriia bacterium]
MSPVEDSSPWIPEIERFCAYQERSPHEVRMKLSRKGLSEEILDKTIAHLISKRFLDEKRFVEAYVHGKFAIKGWGVNKIKAGLRAHKIHETLISFGLTQLETEATKKVLEQWLSKKRQALRNEPESPKKNAKIIRFLLTKGFEMDQILSLIRPF